MQLQNTLTDVKYIGDIVASNNPIGLISSLNNEGVIVPSGTTQVVLSNLLFSIFNEDKSKWIRIIKSTPFDVNANNWTTNADVISSLQQTVSSPSKGDFKSLDVKGILGQIGDFIGGSSTTGGGSKTITSAVSPTTAAVVTIIVVAIIGLIIWKA